jgi:hypothetical protein
MRSAAGSSREKEQIAVLVREALVGSGSGTFAPAQREDGVEPALPVAKRGLPAPALGLRHGAYSAALACGSHVADVAAAVCCEAAAQRIDHGVDIDFRQAVVRGHDEGSGCSHLDLDVLKQGQSQGRFLIHRAGDHGSGQFWRWRFGDGCALLWRAALISGEDYGRSGEVGGSDLASSFSSGALAAERGEYRSNNKTKQKPAGGQNRVHGIGSRENLGEVCGNGVQLLHATQSPHGECPGQQATVHAQHEKQILREGAPSDPLVAGITGARRLL